MVCLARMTGALRPRDIQAHVLVLDRLKRLLGPAGPRATQKVPVP